MIDPRNFGLMLYKLGDPAQMNLDNIRFYYQIDGERDFINIDLTGHTFHPELYHHVRISESFITIRHQCFYMKVGVWYSEDSKSIISAWYRLGYDHKPVYQVRDVDQAEEHVMAALLYV